MKCISPVVLAKRQLVRCGQCLPCRIQHRRVWQHRLLLEASQHETNAFVTLTYDEDHAPEDGSLDPAHLRNFLKRLRRAYEPLRFRFFGVGEYGDETQRPHYHVALFGAFGCQYGASRYAESKRRKSCCSVCDSMREVWGQGNIDIRGLGPESAGYIAGYTTKKLTNAADPYVQEILAGRHPEFSRMSNRPGIGAGAMDDVADRLLTYDLHERLEDVPTTLQHGKRNLPLGRYLRNQLRLRLGRPEGAPESVKQHRSQELQALYGDQVDSAPSGFKASTLRSLVITDNESATDRVTRRFKRRKEGKTL